MTKRRKHLRPRVIARDGLVCGVCGKNCAAPADTGWTTRREIAKAAKAVADWYDRDGSAGGAADPFEHLDALLAQLGAEG
jgi:hypothetical protein